MFQTFSKCMVISEKIEINANLSGSVIMSDATHDYKDYEQCFNSSSLEGDGVIISQNSKCGKLTELYNTKAKNSKIILEND